MTYNGIVTVGYSVTSAINDASSGVLIGFEETPMQRNAYFRRAILAVPFALCTSVAAQAQNASDDAKAVARLKDAKGNAVGTVTVKQLEHGVLFSADLKNLPPGGHGFHVHELGACEPDFKAAGGHYSPLKNEHGFNTPKGYHVGDLPNVYVAEDGTAKADFFAPRLTLNGQDKSGGEKSGSSAMQDKDPFPLLDDDGSALLIHKNPDDYEAVPPDSTGPRIACGVIGNQTAGGKSPLSATPFSEVDADGDNNITQKEAKKAGLGLLTHRWKDADNDGDGVLSKDEFSAYREANTAGDSKPESTEPEKEFAKVDTNNNKQVSDDEARKAGLTQLVQQWNKADKDYNGTLNQSEFLAFMGKPSEKKASTKIVGQGQFKSPETAIWDKQADTYLVSNINGKLTAQDDNGFISSVSPGGTVLDLKWIDGASPEVTLHGPKGMLIQGKVLVVADVGAVRFFQRDTGKPIGSIAVPDSYMLNDVAMGSDGLVYVTDTGSKKGGKHPGAVYRLDGEQAPVAIAKGDELNRPDGLIAHDDGLLVTPFAAEAKEVYKLSLDGEKTPFATLPEPKLDGLLRLPDDSIVVTSWKGKTVYRLVDGQPEAIAKGITSPAQVGYDEKRGRLLVPSLKENKMLVRPLEVGG
jgi:Cu-Zn family superoxide dismutase